MTRKQIELFLVERKGYLKKSSIAVAEALWKITTTKKLNKAEIEKQLSLIKEVQSDMRRANIILMNKEQQSVTEIYNKVVETKNRPKKRLFFDIETSPNIVFSWRVGYKINLDSENIINERAIICICYKWEGEDKVHSLRWNKGCDKEVLQKFSKVLDSADEIIGHNSDKFDVKWVRARCIFHRIPLSPKFNSLDTLKFSRAGFNFNSNKLNYIAQFLGIGKKLETGGFGLWKDIVLHNSKEALDKMVTYCQKDVILLEEVYQELKNYVPEKKFKYRL